MSTITKPTVRRIAWSARSASNGYITRWSRWHLTTTLTRGEKTLCGETLPFAKWLTPQPADKAGDYRIRGGQCAACLRLANTVVSHEHGEDNASKTQKT